LGIKRRDVHDRGNVLCDEEIEFTGYEARICPHRLRQIVVWDEENQREIVLLTNQMDFAASTNGCIYKDRWQIELFFKAIKQNLKIKTFVGTSENAVKTQIWTALLCMLVLKILQMRSTFGWIGRIRLRLSDRRMDSYYCLNRTWTAEHGE
jgi:IS4 transposase